MDNPGSLLEPGDVSKQRNVFNFVNEKSLRTKVLKNIETLNKTRWKKKLGTGYSHLVLFYYHFLSLFT